MSHDPSNLPVISVSTLLKKTTYDSCLSALLEQAERTFSSARPGSTLRAYEHDSKVFRSCCEKHEFVLLPASSQSVIFYATQPTPNQSLSLGTLRRLAAISQAHQQMHFDSPTKTWEMKKFVTGLRRGLGVLPEQTKAISVADLKKIGPQIPHTLLGKRDRAILSLGSAGAFRQSDFVAIDLEDRAKTPDGMTANLKGVAHQFLNSGYCTCKSLLSNGLKALISDPWKALALTNCSVE